MSFKDLYDPDFKPRGAGESESEKHWKPIERDRRKHEFHWLIESFDLLDQNRQWILGDHELYGVPLKSAGVETTLTVPYKLNLGPLLELWDSGEFRRVCPDCGEQAYVVYACGSILSGTHSWGGFCREEAKSVSRSRRPGLGELFHPASYYYDKRKSGELVDSDLGLSEVIKRLKEGGDLS